MEDTPEKVYFEPTQSIEHEVKSAPIQLSKDDGAKEFTESATENFSEDVSGATVTENVTPDETSKDVVETDVTKNVTIESKNLDSSVGATPSEPAKPDVTTPVTKVETNVTNVDTEDDTLNATKSECNSELNQQQVSFQMITGVKPKMKPEV